MYNVWNLSHGNVNGQTILRGGGDGVRVERNSTGHGLEPEGWSARRTALVGSSQAREGTGIPRETATKLLSSSRSLLWV